MLSRVFHIVTMPGHPRKHVNRRIPDANEPITYIYRVSATPCTTLHRNTVVGQVFAQWNVHLQHMGCSRLAECEALDGQSCTQFWKVG